MEWQISHKGRGKGQCYLIDMVIRAKRIEIEEWGTKNENEQILSSEPLMLGTWF